MLPVRLFVQAGPLPLAVSSLCVWNLSPFGCPLIHFNMQNHLLIFLVLFLVAARCLVGQFDNAEQGKGKAFMQSSFISLNVTTSGDIILLF